MCLFLIVTCKSNVSFVSGEPKSSRHVNFALLIVDIDIFSGGACCLSLEKRRGDTQAKEEEGKWPVRTTIVEISFRR